MYLSRFRNHRTASHPVTQIVPISLLILCSLVSGVLPARGQAQTLERQQVSDHVWMLSGRGGNVAVVVTGDGAIVIDTQYTDSAPAIIEQVRAIETLDAAIESSSYNTPKAPNIGRGVAFADRGSGGGRKPDSHSDARPDAHSHGDPCNAYCDAHSHGDLLNAYCDPHTYRHTDGGNGDSLPDCSKRSVGAVLTA